MATTLQRVDLDFGAVASIKRALHNPVATDPTTPVDSEVWYRTDLDKLRVRANGVTQDVAFMSDVTAGGMSASLFDAQTVLYATTDNTPLALVVGASTIVGRRASGNIVAITYAQLEADLEALGINAQTLATFTPANLRDRATHTGAQLAATISDFSTAADARVAASNTTRDARYNAESTLIAITDNTPVVQAFAASTVLGRRATGSTTAITYALLKTDLEALSINAATLATFTPANLRDRSTHTGSQAASTISDFSAAADARITAFVGAAPGAMDTLDELAAALGDDPNFATTVNTALGLRTRKHAAAIGNGALTDIAVTHSLGSTDVIAQARLVATNAVEECAIVNTDANTTTFSFNVAPAASAVRVTIIG